ncbi:hypothetical protein C8J57DRAFT_1563932 [Mycena rebaudengoi]|nr:hypothetical protein C8J57DRAFT_1563932 [Mycena rebaudengoi]
MAESIGHMTDGVGNSISTARAFKQKSTPDSCLQGCPSFQQLELLYGLTPRGEGEQLTESGVLFCLKALAVDMELPTPSVICPMFSTIRHSQVDVTTETHSAIVALLKPRYLVPEGPRIKTTERMKNQEESMCVAATWGIKIASQPALTFVAGQAVSTSCSIPTASYASGYAHPLTGVAIGAVSALLNHLAGVALSLVIPLSVAYISVGIAPSYGAHNLFTEEEVVWVFIICVHASRNLSDQLAFVLFVIRSYLAFTVQVP